MPDTDEIKSGARHSSTDQQHINQALEHIVAAGGDHPAFHPTEIVTEALPKSMPQDDGVVSFGSAVKALGNGKVGGYLVRFTDANTPDLTGEYFTAETDFDTETPAQVRAYFNHGLTPGPLKKLSGRANLSRDEFGVWAETILDQRNQYEAYLYGLAEKGKIGWSSGSASHLVEREPGDKATRIKAWPIAEASLTHMPAEPRNSVIPIKSLIELLPPSLEADTSGVMPVLPIAPAADIKNIPEEVYKMADNIDIQAIANAAADEALKRQAVADPTKGIVIVQDEADKLYPPDVKGLADFMIDVRRSSQPGSDTAPRLKAIKAASGANEAIPAEGGFLVQNQHAAMFLENTWESSTVAGRAMRDSLTVGNGTTMYGINETSRATGSRWGGVRGYRLAEAGSLTASKPAFKEIELKLKKYGILAYATQELLDDAPLWASKMLSVAPKELAFMLDDDVMNGTGGAGPLGIMQSPAIVEVSKETGQAAATIVAENIDKMWVRRLGNSPNYAWFVDQSCEAQLNALTRPSGVGALPFQFANYGPDGILRLYGRPVISTEFQQVLGTAGDIVLANLNDYYQIIDKGGVQSAVSLHLMFLTDEQAFRWIYRVDGAPLISSAITPKSGGDTQTPFVRLAVRS